MTITADFSGGEKTITTDPLYQWDTGQKLALSGLPATSTDIQVHFANAAMAQAIVKATATENSLPTCDIPNEFLQYGSAAKARAWVFYRASNTEGYTVRTVLIPVTPRKRPNDYVSPEDPDSKGIVERAIELLEHYQSDLDGKLNDADGSVKTANLDGGAVTEEKLAAALQTVINGKEVKSNKKTTLTGNETSNEYYPTTKAVADALSTKAPASTAYTFDSTTANVTYNTANPKTIYLNATVDGEAGIVITAKDNGFQYFLGRSGTLKIRYFSGGTSYSDWTQVTEHVGNKKNSITSSNRTSTEFYPSIKAVVDYLTANYIGSGNNTVSWDNLAVAVKTTINGKENTSNKLTSEDGIDEDSTDTEYPTAKAVFNFGADILEDVAGDLVRKESISNKKNAIAGNETSEEYYPTTKAVYDYGSQISSAVEDVKAYIGYTSGDILGLQADFENKVFTRLGAAVGKNAGSDFDVFPMYGGRRRVVVDSDNEIDESIAPASVTETDYDYDVMVYQPKFYYKVVPLKLEKQSSGLGYHIRKANYYISATPHAGFKVHPLFIDKNGNEVDYVLFSAYEASYFHNETGNYSYFHDGAQTNANIDWSHDELKSSPGVKPISGQYKAMNRVNMENLAQRKSTDWHLDTIQSVCANQLLMAIEYGSFNTQTSLGNGVVSNSSSGSNNCSSITGSTSAAAFNTASGMASETIYDVAGTQTAFSANGKVAVSYRGMENPWGNIWKHVNGINIWGDGSMNGGQVYICSNYSFNEESHSDNYKSAGFTVANSNGQISAFGYGDENCDWLFMPSETTGNSSLPVSDYFWCSSNLNSGQSGYRAAPFGGRWSDGTNAGGYYWRCNSTTGINDYYIGGRLLFVPAATV